MRKTRGASGAVLGGVSGNVLAGALADLTIEWWPGVETFPMTDSAETALRILIVGVGTVLFGVIGLVVQVLATKFTTLGEE